MTNEARAESPNFTRLSYALQGAIDEANCQRKDDMLTAITLLHYYTITFTFLRCCQKPHICSLYYILYILIIYIIYNIKF